MINVIAEIGINHKGSIEKAKELINQAASAGCWAVKFQFRDVDSFYKSCSEIGDEILLQEIQRTNLTINELLELSKYARNKDLKFGVSFFRAHDFKLMEDFLEFFDFFKVPSAECTNFILVEKLLDSGKQVMVSTGGHLLEDIKNALLQFANKDLIIFHCVANYPAKLGAQNLLFINELKEAGFENVGYSSHDEDFETCILAMSMGAKWVERHLTFDVSGDGLDDSSSSEISDFFKLNSFAKNMINILGKRNRIPNQGEILNMQNLGTSLYANSNLKKGTLCNIDDFEISAPRVGMSTGDYLLNYKNKSLTVDIGQGVALLGSHFEKESNYDEQKLFSFAKNKQIGIPVRLHDYNNFSNKIKTGVYEFHLSYGEVLSESLFDVIKYINPSDSCSLHLPDYLSGNRVIDPISENKDTRLDSQFLILRALDFAKAVSNRIQKKVPIVGSFSQRNNRRRKEILDDLFSFIDLNVSSEMNLYPQWLPVYAWYFGGSVKLDLFNSLEDINYLVDNSRDICLDLCHLALSAKYFGYDWRDWYKLLKPFSKHMHLADSHGVDGEGLAIGEGDIGDFSIFLLEPSLKIIEVWQGHHNDGRGFMRALDTLFKQEYNK